MSNSRFDSVVKTAVASFLLCSFITLLTGVGPNMNFLTKYRYLTGFDDSNICNRTIGYSPIPLPRVMLRSFPGSGNTWARLLLQLSTGVLTGSIYIDTGLTKNGFPAGGVLNLSVVTIKTHYENIYRDVPPSYNISGSILIVRHSNDAIMAEYNRQTCKSHTCIPGKLNMQKFQSFYTQSKKEWFQFNRRVIFDELNAGTCRLLITNYAEMKTNPEVELRRMLTFLKQSHRGVKCATGIDTSKFRRKKSLAPAAVALAKQRQEQLAAAAWYKDDNNDKDIVSLVKAYNSACPQPVIDPDISIGDRNLKTKYFPA